MNYPATPMARNYRATCRPAILGMLIMAVAACASTPNAVIDTANVNAEDLLTVDCLLPPQVRQLGTQITYLAPRRPIRTSGALCAIRGGEYVAYDRADFKSALSVWLPQAEQGDPQAQTYVGEIYEKGLGTQESFDLAALWYKRAADQDYSRAKINLGYLYESGLGVPKDLSIAMNLYREASGFTAGDLEYVSSIEVANREAAKVESQVLQTRVVELEEQLQAANRKYALQQENIQISSREVAELRKQIEDQRQLVSTQSTSAGQSAFQTAASLQRIEELESQLNGARGEQSRLATKLAEQQLETATLRQQFAVNNQEIFSLQQDLKNNAKTITQLESRIAQQDQSSAELPGKLSEAKKRSAALENEISALRASRNQQSSSIEALLLAAESSEAALNRAIDQQNDEINLLRTQQGAEQQRYQAQIQQLQQRLSTSQSEQQRLNERLAGSEVSRADALASNESLQRELNEKRELVASQLAEQESLRSQLANITTESQSGSTAQQQALEEELENTNRRLEQARAEQTRLTGKLTEQQLNAEEKLAALESQLAAREAEVAQQQAALDTLQADVSNSRNKLNARPSENITQIADAGPSIDIIDPPVLLTRGTPTLPRRPDQNNFELVGKINPPDSLFEFRINGQSHPVNDGGLFRYTPEQASEQELELVAIDKQGASTRLALTVGDSIGAPSGDTEGSGRLTGPRIPLDDVEFGNYYALIIGNDEYTSMTPLRTAGNDATAIERLFREKYGFKTELLLNADQRTMLLALDRMRSTLGENDNLVIYYAGHGELDEESGRGFWLPVDASASDDEKWIANSAITGMIDNMVAKHVLVIADSCYSGTLTRSSVARALPDVTSEQKLKWLKAVSRSRVRTVLSSGGIKPVFDGSPDSEHSVFAEVFLNALRENTDVLEVYKLFFEVQQKVSNAAAALNVDQTPQYAPIRHSGHEAGEFIFVPSNQRTVDASEFLNDGLSVAEHSISRLRIDKLDNSI